MIIHLENCQLIRLSSFHWMDTYGDPDWVYHTTIAKVWGLLAAKFVEAPIIPFNATDYATAFAKYVGTIEKQVASAATANVTYSLHNLTSAVHAFKAAAVDLDAQAADLTSLLSASSSAPDVAATTKSKVAAVNHKYKHLERQFLYSGGLDERHWFKHVVFAPGRWTGYAGATLPGLVESVEDEDAKNFAKWEAIVVGRVEAAVKLLKA